jgi:hypothetical protein
MDAERSWGEDAVAVGRRGEPGVEEKATPAPRDRRQGLLFLGLGAGVSAAIVLVVLISSLTGGGGAGGRQLSVPAADVVPARRRSAVPKMAAPRPERLPEQAPNPTLKGRPKGKLERRDREPKASGPEYELAVPEAPPAEAPPVNEVPEAATTAPAPPSPPTAAAVEFGL